MNIFQKIRAYLQLREALREANNAHAKNGERYYVLPTSANSNEKPRLIVMDRRNFRILKHKGYIPCKANVRDLVAESFYFTPYANGSGYITNDFFNRKKRQFYSWYDAALAANSNKRNKR